MTKYHIFIIFDGPALLVTVEFENDFISSDRGDDFWANIAYAKEFDNLRPSDQTYELVGVVRGEIDIVV